MERNARTLWLGQEFVDEPTRDIVKRVVLSTVVMGFLQFFSTGLGLCFKKHVSTRAFMSSLFNCGLGLVLPVVGFLGAIYSNTIMMCCFCSCNLVALIIQVLLFATITAALVSVNNVVQASCAESCLNIGCGNFTEFCSCDISCVNDEGVICCSGFWKACALPGSPEDVDCGELSMFTGITTILFVIMSVVMLPVVVLITYAWWNGMKLWQRLTEGDALVAGEAVSIRPMMQMQQRSNENETFEAPE